MKYICSILLSIICVYGNAQEAEDVVALKNGTIYKGTISEYVPQGKLTMILVDGRTIEIDSDEIKTLDEEKNRGFLEKDSGFFHSSSIGFLLGNGTYENEVNFQYNMVNGYKWKSIYFGVGTGIETTRGQILNPVYCDIMYQFSKGKTSPFIAGQIGKTINFGYKDDLQNFYADNFKNGNMVGFNFGLRNNFNSDLALILSAGYRYYDLKGKHSNRWWNGFEWNEFPIDTNTILHRFNLKIGLLFN